MNHLYKQKWIIDLIFTNQLNLFRNRNSIQGRKHVKTVPVKLLRPENSLRKKNQDRYFARSFCEDMKDLDPLFGPDCINYISADDKARIQLGKDYYIDGQNTQHIILMITGGGK